MQKQLAQIPGETSVQFLDEGAANVVYFIHVPADAKKPPEEQLDSLLDGDVPMLDASITSTPSTSYLKEPTNPFKGKLLRLRKMIPSTIPPEVCFARFEEYIKPLFPKEDLVEQELVRLPPHLTSSCNSLLQIMEKTGKRKEKRHNVYHFENDEFGLLITDMTPTIDGEIMISFKPKWLAQSPSAPKKAVRCRTCALKKMRDFERLSRGKKPEAGGFCPLDLMSSDESVVEQVTDLIAPHQPKWLQQRILRFLLDSPILPLMKRLQQKFDNQGIFQMDEITPEFLTAMTLRDCSLFIKIPPPGAGQIEARLGDLDLKQPTGDKLKYWKEIEAQLIREGWYEKPLTELFGKYAPEYPAEGGSCLFE
ncbi:MAG: Inositol-pentakisphosphate 2-kinase [Cirrosporium novae-zelandiae]|nr:MAG: Inositol-pentakisphosphate 2-kinase [Cirrosporium novae-zelandiae]